MYKSANRSRSCFCVEALFHASVCVPSNHELMKKRPASRASVDSVPAEVPALSGPAEVLAPSARPLLKRARSQRALHFGPQANSRIFGNLDLASLDISDSDDDNDLILPASWSSAKAKTPKAHSVGSFFKQAVLSCALLECCACLLLHPVCRITIPAQLVQIVGAACTIGHRPLLLMFDTPDLGDGLRPASEGAPVKDEQLESPSKGSPGLQAAVFLLEQSPGKDGADDPMSVESSSASAVPPPASGGSAGSAAGLMCSLCSTRKAAAKSKWCNICKADVQAARRESQDKGEGEWFRNMLRTAGEPLQDFMHEYVKVNGATRRKFAQRCKFDFLKYKEARRIQTSYRLGYKAGVFLAA